jgi:hypothetical protein
MAAMVLSHSFKKQKKPGPIVASQGGNHPEN